MFKLYVPNIVSLGICFIKKIAPQSKLAHLLDTASKICVIFGVRFVRRKVDKKRKPAGKLKHANSILEYFEYFCQNFEYFCQMSSKSILIISSYTVSKLVHFF